MSQQRDQMKGAYSANSTTKPKFKFDLKKFEQTTENKLSTNDVNEVFKNTETSLKPQMNESQVYDFTVLERNKLKKFFNVDKERENKNYSEMINSSNTILRFSNGDRLKDREIDVENFNIYNHSPISVNSRHSGISHIASRDFESPQKQQHNGIKIGNMNKENEKYEFESDGMNKADNRDSKGQIDSVKKVRKDSNNNFDFYNNSPVKQRDFIFNLKKISDSEMDQNLNMKKNESNKHLVRFKEDVEFDMEIKKNQNVFFNTKKIKEKPKFEKINESDLILKNEELKEEFLNEHNFTIDVDKKRKLKLDTINSNGTNQNTNAVNKDSTERESRRMLLELVKLKMKIERKRKPQSILNNLQISSKILDSKPLKYSNNNHRMSYGNLHKVDNKKYLESLGSNNKMARSYNTGLLISNFPVENENNLTNTNNSMNNVYNINIINNFNNNINYIYDSSNNESLNIDNFNNMTILSNSMNRTSTINLSLEDTLSEKVNFLCYLATPKILKIQKSNKAIIPYIFMLVPSDLCQTQIMEHYILQWSDINTMKEVGRIDTLNILSCEVHSENTFLIKLSETTPSSTMNSGLKLNFNSDLDRNNELEVIAPNREECKLYVDYLNLVCNLVKSRFYSNHANKILISNY